MNNDKPQSVDRWDETDETDVTLENGERVFRNVWVVWQEHPIRFASESQLWWIITMEELHDDAVLASWSEMVFGQTALLIADGWHWADKPFKRPVPYWRTV